MAAPLAITGVYAVSCRHVLIQPSGVIDFHKGERCVTIDFISPPLPRKGTDVSKSFAYVDVAVGSVLKQSIREGVRRNVFSYDSACGYMVNLYRRLSEIEPPLITEEDLGRIALQALIPKFHLGGHKAECSDRYSFNYTKDVGRMSGELVETPWAAFNWLQYSVREMGWGNRRDTLNDHFNGWNWWKIVRMGASGRFRMGTC